MKIVSAILPDKSVRWPRVVLIRARVEEQMVEALRVAGCRDLQIFPPTREYIPP
ncbi:hypothetical protein LCGC14_3149970, partial [marine sediment metagenome]